MDRIEIQEKLIEILSKHTSIERASLSPDKHLKFDLGLDSLDVAEMVYEIEATFGISIADDAAEKIQKISDTVDFIHERMQAAAQDHLTPQEHYRALRRAAEQAAVVRVLPPENVKLLHAIPTIETRARRVLHAQRDTRPETRALRRGILEGDMQMMKRLALAGLSAPLLRGSLRRLRLLRQGRGAFRSEQAPGRPAAPGKRPERGPFQRKDLPLPRDHLPAARRRAESDRHPQKGPERRHRLQGPFLLQHGK